MIEKSKASNIFLMDALWTLCLPHILKTKEIVESGQLGQIVSVKADFGFRANFDPNSRLFNRDLGGGALLDIGIYPLMLSLFLLGKPKKITAAAYMGATKVDEDCAVFWIMEMGKALICTLLYSLAHLLKPIFIARRVISMFLLAFMNMLKVSTF